MISDFGEPLRWLPQQAKGKKKKKCLGLVLQQTLTEQITKLKSHDPAMSPRGLRQINKYFFPDPKKIQLSKQLDLAQTVFDTNINNANNYNNNII